MPSKQMLPALVYQDFPSVEATNKGATNIMPRNSYHSLLISCLDTCYEIFEYHELLRLIASELHRNTDENLNERLILLIELYLEKVEPCIEEIKSISEANYKIRFPKNK